MNLNNSPPGGLIPFWLSRSQSPTHIKSVLQTLWKREEIRERARSASRPQPTIAIPVNRITRHLHIPKIHSEQRFSGCYSVAVGSQLQNYNCNRYLDLEPYDRTRVVVTSSEVDVGKGISADDRNSDQARYLNANWVQERYGQKLWIASQAPLPNTAHAFLSAILNPISRPALHLSRPPSERLTSRIRTVVQLTRHFESGRRKAHEYFPGIIGQSFILKPEEGCSAAAIKVTLLDVKSFEEAHCTQSIVSIIPLIPCTSTKDGSQQQVEDEHDVDYFDGDPVTFKHLLYDTWPDHGVPEPADRESLLTFLRLVDKTNRDIPSSAVPHLDPDPPIIVGCSAGVGRTGAFIALSSLLRAHDLLSQSFPHTTYSSTMRPSPLGPLPEIFQEDLVAQEIDSLREQRPGMVQRDEQVLLVYDVLALAFSKQSGPNYGT